MGPRARGPSRPLAVAGILAVGATAIATRRADHDYRRHGRLTRPTAALAWAAYCAHAATFAAALGHERRLPLASTPARLAGGALAATGTGLYLASMRRFPSFAQFSGRSNEQLVTEGIHRYSRNPQNVGYGLVLAGAALAARRPAAVAAAVAFWPLFAIYTRVEERHLARTYGAAYERYRASTPRYLGRPR